MDIVSILKYHSEHQSKGGRGCISLYNSKALSHLTKLTKFYMSSHSQSLFRFPPTVSKTSLYSGCLWIEIQSTFTGFFLIFLFTNNKSHPRVCVCVCVHRFMNFNKCRELYNHHHKQGSWPFCHSKNSLRLCNQVCLCFCIFSLFLLGGKKQ